jgi:hypothetical protein
MIFVSLRFFSSIVIILFLIVFFIIVISLFIFKAIFTLMFLEPYWLVVLLLLLLSAIAVICSWTVTAFDDYILRAAVCYGTQEVLLFLFFYNRTHVALISVFVVVSKSIHLIDSPIIPTG